MTGTLFPTISPTRVILKKLLVALILKKTPHSLQNLKAHYCKHNSLSQAPALSHMNSVHIHHPISFRCISILSSNYAEIFQVPSFLQILQQHPRSTSLLFLVCNIPKPHYPPLLGPDIWQGG